MTFGERLKSLRTTRNWTQPQAADAIGVEQSYLSKLENNHSVPSGDVFARIAKAFEITVAQVLQDLDDLSLDQLSQIPDVANHLTEQQRNSKMNLRLWSQGLAVAVALGAALVYAGFSNLIVADVVYSYKSAGIIQAEESKELFRELSVPTSATSLARLDPEYSTLRERLDERFLTKSTYLGETFSVPIEGGSRTYYLQGKMRIDPWQNKVATFLGIFLATAGFIGLLIAATKQQQQQRHS